MPTADPQPRFTVVEHDAPGTMTTLKVRDAIFEPHDLAMNPRTGETVIVREVSDHTIVCRRDVVTGAAPMRKGDELFLMSRSTE